jgi:hypothetical protein
MNMQPPNVAAMHPINPKPGRARALKRIRLELARSKEFPAGSPRNGYEFTAPLDANRYIDLAQWKVLKDFCRVRRFWDGEEDQSGRLVYKPGGSAHAFWAFDYDPNSNDDDEPGYRFGSHAFLPGEYVTIKGHDGEQHTFRVVSVVEQR